MYLMYVDESGDIGLVNSPTDYYILSGIVVHETSWRAVLDKLVLFKRAMHSVHGLYYRQEIHASAMLSDAKDYIYIPKDKRLAILRNLADELSKTPQISILNVVVNKSNKPANYDVFFNAWRALLQRFENTLLFGNFPPPKNTIETGMVFPDMTDRLKLTKLLRKIRRYNPVTNNHSLTGYSNFQIRNIVEDPNFRNSQDSIFIQSADLVAYLLFQKIKPNKYIRKKGAKGYFNRLQPVLCTSASKTDPQGIVWL